MTAGALWAIDQTQLPWRELELELRCADDIVAALAEARAIHAEEEASSVSNGHHGAAAGLIASGEVDAVVVGCDRVAADGDVANKVGTYSHALAAAGRADPVRGGGAATPCRNPAFDVTPAALVTALVTECGVAAPVTGGAVLGLLG